MPDRSNLSNAAERYKQRCEESGMYSTMKFSEYLELVKKNSAVIRTAHQRVYDMILSHDVRERTEYKKKVVHYNFFDDPFDDGFDAVFGLDVHLMPLVDAFHAASMGYGAQQRILLLHGPVGSAKSTIARLLKKGLERYTHTEEGALFTFAWKREACYGKRAETLSEEEWVPCPMNEEPLHLIPKEERAAFVPESKDPNERPIMVEGDLCPHCRSVFRRLLRQYKGNFEQLLEENVQIQRVLFSERDRIGIGTFQPKDEKNQDSTELTGDMNYRRIAIFGSDSDPRAFNFDGEFHVANRGLVEFAEVLKLEVAFLYDLLGASQEHRIKPKKFAQTEIDEVIIGHTNNPEYQKLQGNEFMEAFRDRTLKMDIPYITKLSDEIKIYEKSFNAEKVRGKHVAPHTISTASMWAVLTRLSEPKKHKLELIQKLRLYDGKAITGYTEDSVREMRKEAMNEGFKGISPRYIQDKISNALVNGEGGSCINPFMVMNELERGLAKHSLITSEEARRSFKSLIDTVKAEYESIVKNEVQKAISADKGALDRLCANYIDNVKAYTQKEKVKNKYTGQDESPDERLMRSVEEKIEIPESRKEDFRREIMNYIGALAIEGKTFNYRTNERLLTALELKLFEDQKDTIKLTSLVSKVMDKETQEKIEVVKTRLIKEYGYCEVCATDVLNYVASIFARGENTSK